MNRLRSCPSRPVLGVLLQLCACLLGPGCGSAGGGEQADAGRLDIGPDASGDAGPSDSGHAHADAAPDATVADTGVSPPDARVDASEPDAGAIVVQGCLAFVDRTSSDRTLLWNFGIEDAPERCMAVFAGQSVTWSGNFGTHPLSAQGGTLPSPIPGVPPGDGSHAIAFLTPGTYGYICENHAEMRGAIRVIP